MYWQRFLGAVAVFLIVTGVVGAVTNLTAILSTTPVAASVLLVLILVGLVSLTAMKSRRWVSNPYW